MLEDIRVRSKGCISEPSSDISPNWKDMRSEFGYTTLDEIAGYYG
jgi:hypothetical protein